MYIYIFLLYNHKCIKNLNQKQKQKNEQETEKILEFTK